MRSKQQQQPYHRSIEQAFIIALHIFANVEEPHTGTNTCESRTVWIGATERLQTRNAMQWIIDVYVLKRTLARALSHIFTHIHTHHKLNLRTDVVPPWFVKHSSKQYHLPPERMRSCAHLRLCKEKNIYLMKLALEIQSVVVSWARKVYKPFF